MFNKLALAAALTLMPIASFATDTANLSVTITGLNNDKGVVRIALFNSEKTYKEKAAAAANVAFKKAAVTISGQQATYTFADVPYGTYAIKAFHDEDNSGKIAKNAFGMPLMQYGFSNNVRPKFGPASFDKAKFDVKQPSV